MSDIRYRLKDITKLPKGKRLSFFMDYYAFKTLFALIGIVLVVSTIYTIFFAPKPDFQVLYTASNEPGDIVTDRMQDVLEGYGLDYNNDGRCLVQVNFIYTSDSLNLKSEYDALTYAQLVAAYTAHNAAMQIVDDTSFNILLEHNVIATYGNVPELALEGDPNDYIKIPLSLIPAFSSENIPEILDGLYLTIRYRLDTFPTDDPEDCKNFSAQLDVISKILDEAGLIKKTA